MTRGSRCHPCVVIVVVIGVVAAGRRRRRRHCRRGCCRRRRRLRRCRCRHRRVGHRGCGDAQRVPLPVQPRLWLGHFAPAFPSPGHHRPERASRLPQLRCGPEAHSRSSSSTSTSTSTSTAPAPAPAPDLHLHQRHSTNCTTSAGTYLPLFFRRRLRNADVSALRLSEWLLLTSWRHLPSCRDQRCCPVAAPPCRLFSLSRHRLLVACRDPTLRAGACGTTAAGPMFISEFGWPSAPIMASYEKVIPADEVSGLVGATN
jgi:hypothetical protein